MQLHLILHNATDVYTFPIGQVLSISSFKTGNLCDMFNWRMSEGYAFWPLWARQTGTMLQLIPILLIPAAGIIQCIRYLTSGPTDLFEVTRPVHFGTQKIPTSCLLTEGTLMSDAVTNLPFQFIFFLFFAHPSGSNCCTVRTSAPISYPTNRRHGRRPGRPAALTAEVTGGDPVDHVHALDRRRPPPLRFPILRPSTLRHRRTIQRRALGKLLKNLATSCILN